MKKRICFVDGEAQALASLEQAMSGVSGTWDCAFVKSGEEALARLAAEPFDAVVTNLHLPGINGVDLLRETGRLQPGTLRFILGDLADQELVMSGLGGTHQFIARPCPGPALASIVHRSLGLDAWLSTKELRKLVPRLQQLPSLPSTYFELLKQMESPGASTESIAEVVTRDPAATVRLLQVVNSAALALRRKISDPTEAITQLGLDTVRSIVLCVQVFKPRDHPQPAGFSLDALWAHSLSVGTLARELVLRMTRDSRAASDAFAAGLLHDVGRIVLAVNLPQEYSSAVASARQHHRPLDQEEIAQFGATHAQVGAYLLGLWGMPAHLLEATALHHTPNATLTREFGGLTAVHIADVLAHETEAALREKTEEDLALPQLDAAYLTALNLPTTVAEFRQIVAGEALTLESRPDPSPALTSSPSPQPAPPQTQVGRPETRVQAPGWFIRLALPAGALVLLAACLLFWGYRLSGPRDAAAETSSESNTNEVAASPAVSPAQTGADTQSVTLASAALVSSTDPTNALSPVTADAEKASSRSVTETAGPAGAPTTPSPAVPPPAATKGFRSVKVQAIFYRTNDPVVVINGELFSRGDHVNGVEIVSISSSAVTLEFEGKQEVFPIP